MIPVGLRPDLRTALRIGSRRMENPRQIVTLPGTTRVGIRADSPTRRKRCLASPESSRTAHVGRMFDQRSSRYDFPLVTRYVVATFAYGRDLVSYRRTTSNAVELPETAVRTEGRQREAYEEVVAEIERRLDEEDISVPIYEGRLRRPANFGEEG
jgi:hypothetical protein